jgi:hypothetical protein
MSLAVLKSRALAGMEAPTQFHDRVQQYTPTIDFLVSDSRHVLSPIVLSSQPSFRHRFSPPARVVWI